MKVGQKYPSSDYRELDDATSPTVRSTADINEDPRMTTIQRFLRTPQSLEVLSEHIKSRTKAVYRFLHALPVLKLEMAPLYVRSIRAVA